MELVEKKRKLIENFGFTVQQLESDQWAIFDSNDLKKFSHIGHDYESVIEVAFWRVSWEIMWDLYLDKLTPEEAGKYFKGTSDLSDILP